MAAEHIKPLAARQRDRTFVESDEEFNLIAHVRGWCHLSTACRLCKADDAYAQVEIARRRAQRTLDSIITGA